MSSDPAPTGYTRATLDLFQPIQHVQPGDWSGYQLTDDAMFSNRAHPMAQATYADAPLIWPDQSIPPYWDGLYQLRMVFSAPNKVPWTLSGYPTAVIKVTGNTWTLVQGGGSSCTDGTAVSVASLVLPRSDTAVPKEPVKVIPYSETQGTKRAGTTRAAGTATTTVGRSSSSRSASAEPSGTSGGPSAGAIAGGAIAALVLAGAAALLVFRRRRRVA